MKRAILLVSLAVACGTPGVGDTLYFKSGKGFSCLVVGFSNEAFTVVVDGAKQEVPASNVERIEFTVGAQSAQPAYNPFPSAYQFQEEAGHTPQSYLEGKTFGEVTASCSPKDLREQVFSIENNAIKLVFKRRSAIEQIGTNEYRVSLYDDDFEPVMVYFDEAGLKYMRSVKESYGYREAQKKYALYGVALSPKTLEQFKSKYRWGRPVFVPLGKSKTTGMGTKGVAYSW